MVIGEERAERIGRWTSGLAHAGLIGWALLAGALFRAQDVPPIRMTEVATMSEAEFQDYAATARGSGPLAQSSTAIGALSAPEQDAIDSGAPQATSGPTPDAAAQPLAAPAGVETDPDLTGTAPPRAPASIATELPQVAAPAPAQDVATAPEPAAPPQTASTPARPATPAADSAAPEAVADAPPPRSALALDASPRPAARPEGLEQAYRDRIAAAEAARQAEAAREAAAAEEAARQQAEAERIAAEEAARQAEAQRIAAEDARRQAEQAEAQRQAEAERAAQEAEARRRAEAEEAARQAEAARAAEEEAERQAEAERAAQEDAQRQAEADAAAQAAQQGGTAASDDPLTAALNEALAGTDAQAGGQDGLSDELRRARDDAAAAEQAVRDAEAAAAVAARRTEPTGDLLASALDGALDAPGHEDTDGPPLSRAEKDGFRIAIQDCWNKGALSREAADTTVSIRFSMAPDGMPEIDSFRLMGHSGGGPAAAQQAFDVGRRAVLQCARGGYALPRDKYARWKDVIVDFRPDGPALD